MMFLWQADLLLYPVERLTNFMNRELPRQLTVNHA